MSVLVQITIKPAQQKDKEFILKSSLFKAKLRSGDISDWRIRKRSIDARKVSVKLKLQIEFWLVGETRTKPQSFVSQKVHLKPEIAIIGAGPAGLYPVKLQRWDDADEQCSTHGNGRAIECAARCHHEHGRAGTGGQ